MKPVYPPGVTDKILQLTLQTNSFAYLLIDSRGVLIDMGGEMISMSLPNWTAGENILEKALFLTGLVPMSRDYEYLPAYQLGESSVFDVHFFKGDDQIWVILVDLSGQKKWESLARQSANELRLLTQKVAESSPEILNDDSRGRNFEYFKSFNVMALISNDDGSFDLLEPVSDRFQEIYAESFEVRKALFPQHKFPFVENFLIDAQEIWQDKSATRRMRSGPWVEVNPSGEEVVLEAIALNWNDENLLFIEIMDDNYELNHNFLQIGREGILLKNILHEEVRKQTREIRAREEEIALRLICATDCRDDGETGSHIRRLGLYSELIARHLGWSGEDADEIRIAAPMHDIGKIGIPDHILKKPGKLTEGEFDVMKKHPEIGARILANSDSPLVQMARDISLGHHEKWDGSGYPFGLKGDAIPVSARIVAIVDVFDALIHKRVYKDEMPVEGAIELMQEGRGKHFDPEIFDLFLSLRTQMSEIAFDYSNPIGDDFDDVDGLLQDVKMVGRKAWL
jgi:HD-GYP domain-containing protein (c-di-GMP phosphodiesterase class II)